MVLRWTSLQEPVGEINKGMSRETWLMPGVEIQSRTFWIHWQANGPSSLMEDGAIYHFCQSVFFVWNWPESGDQEHPNNWCSWWVLAGWPRLGYWWPHLNIERERCYFQRYLLCLQMMSATNWGKVILDLLITKNIAHNCKMAPLCKLTVYFFFPPTDASA